MKLKLITFSLLALIAVFPHIDTTAQEITIKVRPGGQDDTPKSDKPPFTGTRPAVDVAILLDTSNSMDGLISQAKTQLWNIIQQFAEAQKNGQTPRLRVSVFEYGNSGLPATEGYIRQVVQLTDDMDKVSEALFALSTNGGDEYCGAVIAEALKRLDWSSEPNAYKAIFIAGNEPFTQGSVEYQKSCSQAIQSGVVVNTIHCGDYQVGVSGKWKHGAELAEGEYMNINQDQKVVHIKAPQDEIIIKLNAELNKTYLWYGAQPIREQLKGNQVQQDRNALQSGSSFFSRSKTKAGKMYDNLGRDLVDTIKEDKTILSKVKVEELPKEMQKMTAEQRQAHVEKLASRRGEIQKKLLKVTAEREKFVASKRKEMAEGEGDTLGDAITAAVTKQLQKSGFEVKK